MPPQRRHIGEQQKGQRKPQAQPRKDRKRRRDRQHQRRPHRHPHEWPGARRSDESDQRAGPEGTRNALLPRQLLTTSKGAQFKQPRKVEGDRRDQQQKQQDNARVLQLKRPAHGHARCPDRQQQPAQRQTGEDDASAIGQRLPPHRCLITPSARQLERLQPQDRKHARHDIEQQPAQYRPTKRDKRRAQQV